MGELIKVEISKGVAHVSLNRSEKRNALSIELMQALIDAGEQLKLDKSVRAVVLSGEGKCFCAGIDTTNFTAPKSSSKKLTPSFASKDEDFPNFYQKVCYVWKQIPVPTIAALHGVVFGAGFQLALGADIRIASPDTTMSIMEIKWGLIPDMSATQTLKDLVRIDVAKELMFTGRVVDVREALDLGLVTKISDAPLEEALSMAGLIATKSPDAITFGKKLFNETWHADEVTGFKMEQELQRELLMSKSQIEAITANVEGRQPNFDDRSK